MNTKQLFLRVCEVCPMEVSEFFTHLGTCVRRLLSRYPTGLLAAAGDTCVTVPTHFDDPCALDPLYEGAIILGILDLHAGAKETAFLAEADQAYRTLWRRAAHGLRARAVRG